jgi:hypothetical protein
MRSAIGRALPPSLALLLGAGCVAPPPKIAPPAGIYACPLNVTITDAKADASINYTTDGSSPSATSAKYSSPFPVAASSKVQAVAHARGGKPSGPAVAEYGCAMTRAQFAVLVQQAFSLPPPTGSYLYHDVPDSGPVFTAVEAAAPYMSAYVLCPGCQLPRDFYPDDAVTQATVTLAFVRVLIASGKAQLASPQQTASLLAKFADARALPLRAQPYFATAIAHNILVPSPSGGVRPTALVTQSDVLRVVEQVRAEVGSSSKSPG